MRTNSAFFIHLFLMATLIVPASGQLRLLAIPKPGIAQLDSTTDYLVYYGAWDADKLFRAMDFRLIILEPSNITASQVTQLRNGHDGIPGTSDDVLVIGYLSIGEDNAGNRVGNGAGPCYWRADSSKIVYENKGYASWYVDDADHNNLPDENSTWGSYYVNGGDTLWWQFLKSNPAGADHTLVTLGLDGLFLDTIDSASPFSGWPYAWTTKGMSDLIGWLRQQYPTKILFANRGLFYFNPADSTAYANTIRPYIDADMYESYYADGQRAYWALRVNTEAQKPDGFKVVALDYIAPTDMVNINAQVREVFNRDWADYISDVNLDQIRYEVFHRHAVDSNPPTWNSSIGAVFATAADQSVTLSWNSVTDQSLPVRFNLYYSTALPFTIGTATKLASVAADTSGGLWHFTVTGLTNYTTYHFVVRAQDALGNEDKNLVVISATPPNVSPIIITINGDFSDWAAVPSINQPPNSVEPTGDVSQPDADLANLWAYNDTDNLYLSYSVAGTFSSSSYFYHIYIDVDENPLTGFRYQDTTSIGAEFMVENDGLWQYTGTGGSNWSWAAAAGMSKATAGGRTELSIPFATLGKLPGSGGGIRLVLQDNLFASPYTLVDIAPNDFVHQYFRYAFLVTGVGRTTEPLPATTELLQNFPNPFNPATTVGYRLSKSNHVSLKVFDVLGREVATLVNEVQSAGDYAVRFDGRGLGSGIYYLRLTTDNFASVRSMLLLR